MNLTIENSLNTIFDVSTNTVIEVEAMSLVPETKAEIIAPEANTAVELSKEEIEAKEDYEFTRNSLKNLADKSQDALISSIELAKSLERPAGFEAVANMVKSTIEAHRALQELHKSAAEVRISSQAAKGAASPVNVEKGVVFAGTAEDLLRLLDPSRT